MLGMGDRLGEKHPDVIVVQRIDDVAPISFADDKAQVTKYAELLRDGRLLHLDIVGQLTNRAWVGSKSTEDSYPAGSS